MPARAGSDDTVVAGFVITPSTSASLTSKSWWSFFGEIAAAVRGSSMPTACALLVQNGRSAASRTRSR
ncbi:hypothetical protein [Lentzea xinjiangensis]|uniref:hypothetical protein n=1 Tax=Lentzea xinjiangensis TaxID=402600 RepID=UPI001160C6B6|nr:hypothetical protein [Lentzea xinjiangensis]